jgi:hypothetical protein
MDSQSEVRHPGSTPGWMVAVAWLFVGIPLLWGVFRTLVQSTALFR